MEKGIIQAFDFDEAGLYSPLVLAYIGDAVFELYIRCALVSRGNAPVNKLHHAATGYVKAQAQSALAGKIMDSLNEEELTVFKRGRNAHSNTSAKNADIIDYRRATGLEALIGYLYIMGNHKRLEELMRHAISDAENTDELSYKKI